MVDMLLTYSLMVPIINSKKSQMTRGHLHSSEELGHAVWSSGPLAQVTLTINLNDMKRFYKKLFRSNKPSRDSIHGPGPATSTTSTSTLITSTADLMPSLPTNDAPASAHITAGVSVSVQLRPSLF